MKTTSNKYIDLAEKIIEDAGMPCGNIRLGVHEALEWLDEHPEQAPGQTITSVEMGRKCDLYGDSYLTGFTGAGGRVVPNPEPTNAERLAKLIRESAISIGNFDDESDELAKSLDEDGVKAGGDDEH